MKPEAEEFELPWTVGAGGYNDACRIESTRVRVHPQSRQIGLREELTTRSRIGYAVEVEAGRGKRCAAFIVRACNSHHELVAELERVFEWVENNVAYGLPDKLAERVGEVLKRAKVQP